MPTKIQFVCRQVPRPNPAIFLDLAMEPSLYPQSWDVIGVEDNQGNPFRPIERPRLHLFLWLVQLDQEGIQVWTGNSQMM